MFGVQQGIQAGIIQYSKRAQVPQEQYGWDTYPARLSRNWLHESYDNNTAYEFINTMSVRLKEENRLYKHISGLYNPVARLTNLLTSYVYGGSLDFEHMTGGAVPIVSQDQALLDAIKQLFIWSKWGENKSLYVKRGALLGDSPIWICDDRDKQKVRMELVHPSRIRQAEFDEVGNVTSAVIQYRRYDEPDLSVQKPGYFGFNNFAAMSPLQWYEFTMTVNKDKFTTYKNGEKFAFYNDASGNPIPEWDNEYGFVPLFLAQHTPIGLHWGANAFYNCLTKIDKINDLASLLNHQIRKVVIPNLYAAGVSNDKKNPTKTLTTEKSDEMSIMFGPEGSSLTPVTVPIDIAGAMSQIQSMLNELKLDLPELALQDIREKGNLTAPGIKAGFSDAIGRIIEARGQYDQAQVRAIQGAISIGGYNRYDGFEAFGLDSYKAGDLDFWIKDRPVIADELSASERLQYLSTVGTMPPPLQKIALKEMNYTDEEIAEVTTYSTQQAQQNQQMQAQLVAGQGAAVNGAPQLPPGQTGDVKQLPPGQQKPANGAQSVDNARLQSIYARIGLGNGQVAVGAGA